VPTIAQSSADGLEIIHMAALYTPGILVDHSTLLDDRKAKPTLSLHGEDAAEWAVVDGDVVSVMVGETAVLAQAHVNGNTQPGLGLLSGVKKWSGTAVAEIEKSSQ
jgi:anaerobic selenocysteine-containing dehydrogenase